MGRADIDVTDEALCQRVAERDEAAFDALVARYQQRAYRVAWSMVRDAEEARDIAQDAFVRLYQMAGSFVGRARFSTWFYRVVVNLCLDHRRKHRWWRRVLAPSRAERDEPHEDLVDRLPASVVDPGAALEREQVMRRLRVAVDGLSPQQRTVLLLQIHEELSTGEIAAVLECSEATVRVHLHRALATLRKRMRDG